MVRQLGRHCPARAHVEHQQFDIRIFQQAIERRHGSHVAGACDREHLDPGGLARRRKPVHLLYIERSGLHCERNLAIFGSQREDQERRDIHHRRGVTGIARNAGLQERANAIGRHSGQLQPPQAGKADIRREAVVHWSVGAGHRGDWSAAPRRFTCSPAPKLHPSRRAADCLSDTGCARCGSGWACRSG